MNALTQEYLRAVLHYNPETGIFTWRQGRRGARRGRPAGCKLTEGYIQITIDGEKLSAHRLAFLYVDGALPVGEVDHINGMRTDNRFSNLRIADRSLNMQNKRAGWGSLGMLGVCKSRDKFRAAIFYSGSTKHIGTFATPEEAHAAYIEAKRRLHKGCTI